MNLPVHAELIIGHMRYHLTDIPQMIVFSRTILSSMARKNKLEGDAGFAVSFVHVVVLKMRLKHTFLFWSREDYSCIRAETDALSVGFTWKFCLNLMTWPVAIQRESFWLLVVHAFFFCIQGTSNENQVSSSAKDFPYCSGK